ncbi:hypothetical protein EVAR_97722_1 [Eumeta japonica]|uniref:Uncharacterized protein n=1 Tax=Eumeta variegata TaxID=151549 RepID=A0A4C1Y039_EUMVA|nr:hypothetical protein EVAR_97722_1 [Eumeta japonica]
MPKEGSRRASESVLAVIARRGLDPTMESKQTRSWSRSGTKTATENTTFVAVEIKLPGINAARHEIDYRAFNLRPTIMSAHDGRHHIGDDRLVLSSSASNSLWASTNA